MQIKIKPISVNKIWQGRRFMTKEYKEWREEFGKEIMAWRASQHKLHPKCEYPYPYKEWISVKLIIFTKQFKRADVDNFAKPILDALVESNIIEDDKWIQHLKLTKMKTDNEEKIDINIRKCY